MSVARAAWPQGNPLGPEFRVNTYTASDQEFPSVASDTSGNFVVVWRSTDQEGPTGSTGVFGQRYASSGAPLSPEFRVNTYTTNSQDFTSVALDTSGNFVVVWSSYLQDGAGNGVFGQRYDTSGTPLGPEFRVNTYTTLSQSVPSVALGTAGTFVVIWSSNEQDGSSNGVFGQRYDTSGTPLGPEFRVSTYTTYSQHLPSVAADPSGNFVVVWQSYQDGSGYGIFGQRYASSGAPLGPEFRVNTYTTGFQSQPSVASDSAGNFVVVWDGLQGGLDVDIFGQRYASSGAPLGPEFRVNTYTTLVQVFPSVTSDTAGNFVVVWASRVQDGSNFGIFGQRYASSGAPLGPEFRVNTYTTASQYFPSVASDSAGNFVVTWDSAGAQDGSGIGVFGQRYDFIAPQADLGVTKTDGQTTAVAGLPITYTIAVGNGGPQAANGATVTDTVPPAILGASWTCVGTGGGTCTASGSGNINDSVTLPVGATVTYTLTGTVDAAATGTLSNTASVAAPSGVSDPDPTNNSATDVDVLEVQTDVSMAKTDGQTTAVPGQPVTYTITAGNVGPSVAAGATVTDVIPPILLGATWTCVASPGSSCAPSGSGSINDTVTLLVDGTATYTLTGTVDPLATGTLSNTASIAAAAGATDPDPSNNSATDTDALTPKALAELAHGDVFHLDLASGGAAPDVDVFRIRQQALASYEVVVDEASGDFGTSGPTLERVAGDGATIVQSSQAAGVGFARSLRWMNTTTNTIDNETVRVRSAGCTTDCGADDTYRIRAYETTATVPRFNNAGTQNTVLLLQNPTDAAIAGTVYFWSAPGALVGQQAFTLVPRQLLVLNTAAVAPGVGGTMSLVHDGPYDALVGKTVALEPATGFSFDSPLGSRAR